MNKFGREMCWKDICDYLLEDEGFYYCDYYVFADNIALKDKSGKFRIKKINMENIKVSKKIDTDRFDDSEYRKQLLSSLPEEWIFVQLYVGDYSKLNSVLDYYDSSQTLWVLYDSRVFSLYFNKQFRVQPISFALRAVVVIENELFFPIVQGGKCLYHVDHIFDNAIIQNILKNMKVYLKNLTDFCNDVKYRSYTSSACVDDCYQKSLFSNMVIPSVEGILGKVVSYLKCKGFPFIKDDFRCFDNTFFCNGYSLEVDVVDVKNLSVASKDRFLCRYEYFDDIKSYVKSDKDLQFIYNYLKYFNNRYKTNKMSDNGIYNSYSCGRERCIPWSLPNNFLSVRVFGEKCKSLDYAFVGRFVSERNVSKDFNTIDVTSMRGTFMNSVLGKIRWDSGFNTEKVITFSDCFSGCVLANDFYLPVDFVIGNNAVTSNMFYNCKFPGRLEESGITWKSEPSEIVEALKVRSVSTEKEISIAIKDLILQGKDINESKKIVISWNAEPSLVESVSKNVIVGMVRQKCINSIDRLLVVRDCSSKYTIGEVRDILIGKGYSRDLVNSCIVDYLANEYLVE